MKPYFLRTILFLEKVRGSEAGMSEIAIFSGFEAERRLERAPQHCLPRVQSTCMGVIVSTYCQFLQLLQYWRRYE